MIDPPDELSPDGAWRIRFEEHHGRMSHVIRTACLVESASGEELFDDRGPWGFDLMVSQWSEDAVKVEMRHYYEGGNYAVTIRLRERTASIDGGESFPVRELIERLRALNQAARVAAVPAVAPAGVSGNSRLAILLGMVVLPILVVVVLLWYVNGW